MLANLQLGGHLDRSSSSDTLGQVLLEKSLLGIPEYLHGLIGASPADRESAPAMTVIVYDQSRIILYVEVLGGEEREEIIERRERRKRRKRRKRRERREIEEREESEERGERRETVVFNCTGLGSRILAKDTTVSDRYIHPNTHFTFLSPRLNTLLASLS